MYDYQKVLFPLNFYKVLAVEGTMVTVLGNLTIDASTGEIEIQPIAFVGGGLYQVKEFLQEQASMNTWPAAIFFTGSVLSLAYFSFATWIKVRSQFQKAEKEE